jgi:hypothetical protein
MEESLQTAYDYAVRAAAGVVVVINVTSTGASYMGLRAWATGHETVGAGGYLFPLFIDTFPLLAEVALFIGMVAGWRWRIKLIPVLINAAGTCLSVALQVGVCKSPDWTTRATHGMAPVAAWLSLALGTLVFELVVNNKPKTAEEPVVTVVDTDVDTTVDTDVDTELEVVPPPALELVAAAQEVFAHEIARGHKPGLRKIRQELHVGHEKAAFVSQHLGQLVGAN